MKLKYVLMVNAVIALVFGIPFVVAADQSMQVYGLSMCTDGLGLVRYYGGSLVFTGLLAWLMKDTQEVAAQRNLCLSLVIGCVIGCCVALYNQLAVAILGLVWLTVAIYAAFALIYGYFWFALKE